MVTHQSESDMHGREVNFSCQLKTPETIFCLAFYSSKLFQEQIIKFMISRRDNVSTSYFFNTKRNPKRTKMQKIYALADNEFLSFEIYTTAFMMCWRLLTVVKYTENISIVEKGLRNMLVMSSDSLKPTQR